MNTKEADSYATLRCVLCIENMKEIYEQTLSMQGINSIDRKLHA